MDGPHGWDYAAVNTGRLEISDESGSGDVPWGKRLVLPLVETRVPLTLPQMEVDGIARGAKDADLESLENAARRAARFEESAVYNGFEPGGIEGIVPQIEHEPIGLPQNTQEFPRAVAHAVREMMLAGIEGPYALVLGGDAWDGLMQSGSSGYPPQRIIRDLIGGEIQMSPVLEGGLLLSTAGGHFELSVGQDFSIGYSRHDEKEVDLYLTESFSFRVLEPKAAVQLAPE
jgi:uncharacterized linocin/CFP29 family protein